MNYLLIFLSLLFLTLGQFFQKLAAQRPHNSTPDLLAYREFWFSLMCMATGTVFWLWVLTDMEVSKAFPFQSLNFVMIALISRVYFRETIEPTRWLGIVLICAGVVLISQS